MEERQLSSHKSSPLGADALNNNDQNDEVIQENDQQDVQKEQLMQIVGTNQLNQDEQQVHASTDFAEGKQGKQMESVSSAVPSDDYRMYQTNSLDINQQRAMTAPQGPGQYGSRSRFRRSGESQAAAPTGLNGMIHQTFVESDLLKAANIYSQFEKKGNLYENRLYAKTSINQAKLTKEQKQYDTKMKDYPDEMYRINNGYSASKNEQMGQTMFSQTNGFAANGLNRTGKSVADMRSTGKNQFSTQNRSQSQSMVNFSQDPNRTGLKFARTPMSEAKNTAYTNFCVTGGLSKAGTFSQANRPKVANALNPSQLSQRASLFQKVIEENDRANKDQTLSNFAKSTQNMSFQNVQKSLSRVQGLQQTSNVWSLRDQNLNSLNKAIGGKQNIFKRVNNFVTNEPKIFAERTKNPLSNRDTVQGLNVVGRDAFYLQYNAGKTIQQTTITDRNTIHRLSKAINHDGRVFYGKCLDTKGSSNVVISDQMPAGLTSHKKQTKAYRSNTQSRQQHGLYKEEQYSKKPQFINFTRQDYDVLRPNQVYKEKYPNRDRNYIMQAMANGKCHQQYGISDFNQHARQAGIKYHEQYQGTYGQDNQTFKRQNGDYTSYADTLKWNKFS